MNLVLKTDVKKTEAALNKYRDANADIIKANATLERNAAAAFQNRPTHERAQANRTVNALDARSSNVEADESPVSDPSGLVKGLRRVRAPAPEKTYDPFMGMATSRDYYDLRADYPSIRLTKAKNDTRTKAGGFDFQAYFDESLLRAFAGLGCFIDEEQVEREQPISRELVTEVAAESSPGRMGDEVF